MAQENPSLIDAVMNQFNIACRECSERAQEVFEHFNRADPEDPAYAASMALGLMETYPVVSKELLEQGLRYVDIIRKQKEKELAELRAK
jgi:hypothetical protein